MNATGVDRTFIVLGLGRRSLIDVATLLADGWQFYRTIRGSGGDVGASADAVEVERSITVGRAADELHEFWRDPEQLSHVMGRFIEVSAEHEDHQRWEVGRPGGRTVAWDNEIVEDSPGEVLQWKSVEGATIPNEGSVRFRSAPGDWGTEVVYRSRFDPPGGAFGRKVANRLTVVSGALVNKALHRFKSLAETGEIPTLGTNPSARGRGDLL